MVKFTGGIPKIQVFCTPPPPQKKKKKKIMVSDKPIHEAFRIHKTLSTKSISEIFFIFKIYVNLHVPKLYYHSAFF